MQEQTPLSATAACKLELRKLPPRHAGKCAVCRNRDRLGIERTFLGWGKPGHIAREHGIKNRASIYRHAHAANLFERRHRRASFAYKTALRQFQLGQGTNDAVRIAADRIEVAVRQHLSGSAFAIHNWVQAIFRENRASLYPQAAAALRSPGIQEPKSQHSQWAPRMSLILNSRKSLNPRKNAFHIVTKSASSAALDTSVPFLSSRSLCDNESRFVRPETNAKRITTHLP